VPNFIVSLSCHSHLARYISHQLATPTSVRATRLSLLGKGEMKLTPIANQNGFAALSIWLYLVAYAIVGCASFSLSPFLITCEFQFGQEQQNWAGKQLHLFLHKHQMRLGTLPSGLKSEVLVVYSHYVSLERVQCKFARVLMTGDAVTHSNARVRARLKLSTMSKLPF
jgi:hypothetical protein